MTVSLDGPNDPRLRRVLHYWEARRRGRRFPARNDIDPLDIRFVIGWLNLVDVRLDPLRFYFRIHGTQLSTNGGVDLTGKYLDQHPSPEIRQMVEPLWREVVERGLPTHGTYEASPVIRLHRYEALRLPLGGDGTRVDSLLTCTVERA